MLWLLAIPIVAVTALVWACCAAGSRADDPSDDIARQLANTQWPAPSGAGVNKCIHSSEYRS